MSQSFNVMLALQTPNGLAFGYVRDASSTAMSFTVNANLTVGTAMAWRMELKGYSETIMGRLTVTRVLPAAGAGEWPRYDAKVDGIPEDDLALLQVWMEDQEKGGSSRRVEKDPSRFVRDMFAEGSRSASAAQTKLVIDRMNERRQKREQMFKKKKSGIGGDFGLSHESGGTSSAAASQDARARISAALSEVSRRVVSAPPVAEPPSEPDSPMARPPSLGAAPPPLPWGGTQPHDGAAAHLTDDIVAAALEAIGVQASNPPGSPPPPVEALIPQDDEDLIDDDEELIDDDEEPAGPAPTPTPAPPAVQEESSISVDLEASPPRVRIRTTPATYGEDYRRHLRNSGLFLAGIALGARGRPVQVELTLPSGTVIRCAAQVVASLPSGTGLMLALTRSDRDRLAAEAG